MCWVWSYFKTCMQWKDIEYLTKVYIREDGQWLGVNQCLYLRGPSANPVSGIANCRQHILQHTLYTLYSDNWKTVTLQHVLCSTVLAAALHWDNWNNWQWPILALWSTPSQPPILNFHFYSTESVNPSPISWYVTSLLIIRELPAHDLILTCAFPRAAMIAAIGCIWYLLSWYGFAPSRCKFSGSPNTLCSDHGGWVGALIWRRRGAPSPCKSPTTHTNARENNDRKWRMFFDETCVKNFTHNMCSS